MYSSILILSSAGKSKKRKGFLGGPGDDAREGAADVMRDDTADDIALETLEGTALRFFAILLSFVLFSDRSFGNRQAMCERMSAAVR